MAPRFIGTTAHGKYYQNKNTFRLLVFINNSEFLKPLKQKKNCLDRAHQHKISSRQDSGSQFRLP